MKDQTTSQCCGATIGGSLGDGVLIGTCNKCFGTVCRINPTTGAAEWLDGKSPWTSEKLRPMDEERAND